MYMTKRAAKRVLKALPKNRPRDRSSINMPRYMGFREYLYRPPRTKTVVFSRFMGSVGVLARPNWTRAITRTTRPRTRRKKARAPLPKNSNSPTGRNRSKRNMSPAKANTTTNGGSFGFINIYFFVENTTFGKY